MPSLMLDLLRCNKQSLTSLTLDSSSTTYFDDGELPIFLDALRNNTTVHFVRFGRTFLQSVNQADLTFILDAVGRLQSLLAMEFEGSMDTLISLSALCKAVQQARRLTLLRLKHVCLAADRDCCGLLHEHPSLRTFHLSEFRVIPASSQDLTGEGGSLDSLWLALTTCLALQKVEIVGNTYTHTFPVNSSGLPFTSASALATLMASSNVQHLTLKHLGLKGKDVLEVFETVERHERRAKMSTHDRRLGCSGSSSLRVLDLSWNHLDDASCLGILKFLTPSEPSRNHALSNLRELHLRGHTGLTDTGLSQIAYVMQDNHLLVNLVLSSERVMHNHGKKDRIACSMVLIDMFLRLNRAGRLQLLQGDQQATTKRHWVEAAGSVADDLNAILYLVRANPSICKR